MMESYISRRITYSGQTKGRVRNLKFIRYWSLDILLIPDYQSPPPQSATFPITSLG